MLLGDSSKCKVNTSTCDRSRPAPTYTTYRLISQRRRVPCRDPSDLPRQLNNRYRFHFYLATVRLDVRFICQRDILLSTPRKRRCRLINHRGRARFLELLQRHVASIFQPNHATCAFASLPKYHGAVGTLVTMRKGWRKRASGSRFGNGK